MARYYFHIRDDQGVIPDEEGSEHGSVDAARVEALRSVRDLAADAAKRGELELGRFIDVADGDGTIIFSIPFGEAVMREKRRASAN